MRSLTERVDRIIFKSFNLSNEALGFYRICFCVFLILVGVPVFTWIKKFPDIFFNPPPISIGALFTTFPSYFFLFFLSICVCILTVLLLFGVKPKLVSLLLGFFILIGKSFSYSLGKIDHDFLVWLTPMVMAFSNWGKAFTIHTVKVKSENDANSDRSWPVTLMALFLCLAMFSAAVPKIMGGWLNFSTQAVRAHLLSSYFQEGRQDFLAPYFLKLKSRAFWEMFDYAAIIFESTFLFALMKPNIFRGYVYMAILFHVMNLLMLNISFTGNCIFYLLFIDWKMVMNFLEEKGVLKFLRKMITVRNLTITLLLYAAFYIASLILSSDDVDYTISPVKSILKLFIADNTLIKLIIGNIILFFTLVLSTLNVILYFKKRKNLSASNSYA